METATAGWYDDPENPGIVRFWDGAAWTEARRPIVRQAPASSGADPMAIVGALLLFAAIIGLLYGAAVYWG